jgi:hypothetical protein
MNYIKNLEISNKEKQEAMELATKKLQDFRAFLHSDKFTGVGIDGERKDWIATRDVDCMLLEVLNALWT